MLIPHNRHTDTIHVYSVTVMTHVKALQAGHSSQGTSEPITPGRTAEKVGCGYIVISSQVAAERRRVENGARSGEGGQPPGSVIKLDPKTLVVVRRSCGAAGSRTIG